MKEQIYEIVVKDTKTNHLPAVNASQIADELAVSRNVVSQYLNEYVNEKKLFKINSRPVLFGDVKTIETMYHINMPSYCLLYTSVLWPRIDIQVF